MPGNYPAFYVGVEQAIRTRSAPPVPVADAAYVLDLIAAARHSASKQAVVSP